jgi:hypothetical protein
MEFDQVTDAERRSGNFKASRARRLMKLLAPAKPKKPETQARGRFDDSGLVELLGLGVLPRA